MILIGLFFLNSPAFNGADAELGPGIYVTDDLTVYVTNSQPDKVSLTNPCSNDVVPSSLRKRQPMPTRMQETRRMVQTLQPFVQWSLTIELQMISSTIL